LRMTITSPLELSVCQ